MAILDCEKYSLENIEPAMWCLHHELKEVGKDPDSQPLCLLNLFLGPVHLNTPSGLPFHVCKPRSYGFLVVVFHQVPRGMVIFSESEAMNDSECLCITLMWTADDPLEVDLNDSLDLVDSIIANIEMQCGVPLPFPTKPLQLPTTFEILCIRNGEATRVLVDLPHDQKVNLSQDSIIKVSFAMGFDDNFNDYVSEPPQAALMIASQWQRKAIRSQGLGEWGDVIVASNTWLETLMVRLSVLLNEGDGAPIENVSQEVMRRGIPSFVNYYLGSRFLKGNWDHTNTSTKIGNWHRYCNKKRNEIVHAGHFATETEAQNAYDAAHKLAYYISERCTHVKGSNLLDIVKPFADIHRNKHMSI